jgi:hypothetical protein
VAGADRFVEAVYHSLTARKPGGAK